MKPKKKYTIADVKKMIEAGVIMGSDVPVEMVKAICGALMELEKQKNPPPPPEADCPWRMSDELQRYRLRVPEPSHNEWTVVRYPKDVASFDFCQEGKMPSPSDVTTGEFTRKMFVMPDGSRFFGWTADGINPIFPIPL